jgi:hypothetical protein
MLRNSYSLTDKETKKFSALPQEEGHAWEFWATVARQRGLDPYSIIGDAEGDGTRFSAMPYGHGKDWCWPMPLKCQRKARWNGKDVYFEK